MSNEVNPGDPLYRELQLRGYNRRFVGTPERVFVVGDTDQVVNAVDAVVASGKKLAVRSGGHCTEGFVDDPSVQCVIDLGQMDSVYYDRRRRAFAVEAGATLGRVYQALDMRWGVTLPGGSGTGVGMGGHVTGGGFGPLSRSHGLISDHLYAVETVVVEENGKARAVTATREADDPHRDLWWAHTGGGGGNFGVATKFWFRSPLPERPSGHTSASVAWRWTDLDEETLTTLVNNYLHWCEQNSSPGSPTASVYGVLVLFRKEFGVVTLAGQADSQKSDALDTYFAEVTANVPGGTKTTQTDVPWLYTTIHAPDVPDVLGIPATQLRSKIKGAFLRSALDGSQVRTIVKGLTGDDYGWRGATVVFATWGGQINALSPQDTAVAERDSVALMSVASLWDNPEEDETHLTWTRTLYRDVFAGTGGVPVPGGCFVNWPDPDLLEEEWNPSGVPWSELYYGGNYKKLQEAKARWMPVRSSTTRCRSSRAELGIEEQPGDELSAVGDVELLEDRLEVVLDRVGRQVQAGGDRGVGQALRDELGHAPLARGEAVGLREELAELGPRAGSSVIAVRDRSRSAAPIRAGDPSPGRRARPRRRREAAVTGRDLPSALGDRRHDHRKPPPATAQLIEPHAGGGVGHLDAVLVVEEQQSGLALAHIRREILLQPRALQLRARAIERGDQVHLPPREVGSSAFAIQHEPAPHA